MPTLVMISKKAHEGLTARETWVRRMFVIGYVALTILMFTGLEFEFAGSVFTIPRLFWTVGLPLLPIGIVIAGFYPWRKVCPLAFWGEQGRKFDRLFKPKAKPELSSRSGARPELAAGKPDTPTATRKAKPQRRMPKWAEAWYPMLALGILWLALVGRLLLTNGDGIALGILLIALGVTAALVNWRYTGKTWCNFVCPVSVVERIYTEPNSLRLAHNSQCTTCTACKKNCPDIDLENSYWKDVEEQAKRMAYFAFPGLVLGFYTYFWLRAGDWDAYFGGGWTRQPITTDLLAGPGLFFAPWLPAWAAAPLSLAVFMLASFGLFMTLEWALARVWPDEELRRHRVFTLAAFAAFNLFYLFAGAPSLRTLDYGPRVLAFAVPLVATMFLVKRWKRSRKDHVEERTAKQLLKKWKFKDAPPDDPAGVFAYLKAKESSEEQQLAVYRDSVRQVYSDPRVTKAEVHLLEMLRSQLGVSEGQHRKIMEELATTPQVISVEEELQLQGYRRALTEAMLGNAGEHEFRRLRREYNIDKPTHERIAIELRGEHSPMLERVTDGLARIAELRRDFLIPLAPIRATGTFELALFAVERVQQRALERVLEALPLTVGRGSDAELVRVASSSLLHADQARREQALGQLATVELGPGVFAGLAEVVRAPQPHALTSTPDEHAFHGAIEQMLGHADPYLRAGAIQGIGNLRLQVFGPRLANLLTDEEPIVRETVIHAALRAPSLLTSTQLEPLLRDDEPHIRRAAREAIEGLANPEAIALANPVRVVEGRTLPPIPDDTFSTLATVDKLLFLRCVPLFMELDPEDLHEICRVARERTVASHALICKQGEAGDDLYVVIAGTAAVTIAVPGAEGSVREQEVATLGSGDVVGELSAIDQSPRSASVRANDEPVRMLEIKGDDFRKRVVQRKDVAPKLMATLSRRLRETLARVR